jgi:hypothetical protein
MDRAFQILFTPIRVQILCCGYLACQLAYFLYGDCVTGIYNRNGGVRGHDLLQFYISGRIVADHQSKQLYDNDFFLKKQYEITPFDEAYKTKRTRYFSLYPPTMALLFSPLAHSISYETFFKLGRIWIVAGYYLAARWIVLDLNPPSAWRSAVWVAIASFHPTFTMFYAGQFGWLWLLAFAIGFRLRRHGRDFAAGVCLSLLALKPQWAAAAILWLLLRPAWRTLLGLLVGVAAQATIVAVILGPEIWLEYLRGAAIYTKMHALFQFNAEYQQSVLGTVHDLLGEDQIVLARVIYLVILTFVLFLAFRIFRLRAGDYRVEESTVILMVLLALPHLLIYDLVVLLIPIGHLFALHRERPNEFPVSQASFLFLLPMISLLYPITPGFSLVPIAMLAILYALAFHRGSPSRPLPSV